MPASLGLIHQAEFDPWHYINQGRWCMPIIPAERQKQKNPKFQVTSISQLSCRIA